VEAVAEKRVYKVPLIIGSTSGDSAPPVGADINEAIAAFGRNAAQARAAYVKRGVDPAAAMREISRDRTYAEPARFIAASLTTQGQPVYRYRFSYAAASVRGEMTEGATHASDVRASSTTIRAATQVRFDHSGARSPGSRRFAPLW
jgi:para-nitrobenzyl esterase